MGAVDSVKRIAANKLVDYLCENPEKNFPTIMERLDAIVPDSLFAEQRKAFAKAIDEQNNMYQLLMRVMSINPEVRAKLLKSFLVEGNLIARDKQEMMRDKHECNIPWAILLDPTSVCNLHCTDLLGGGIRA